VASDQDKLSKSLEPRAASKRPYVKPAFRHEQVFETMALACGKVSATQNQCRVNLKNS
jgi:hypothetical protein